jgi:hypothetical protein
MIHNPMVMVRQPASRGVSAGAEDHLLGLGGEPLHGGEQCALDAIGRHRGLEVRGSMLRSGWRGRRGGR